MTKKMMMLLTAVLLLAVFTVIPCFAQPVDGELKDGVVECDCSMCAPNGETTVSDLKDGVEECICDCPVPQT